MDHRSTPRWFPGSCNGRDGRPFIILFEQDLADEADGGVLIGEHADELVAMLDLAVEALDRIGNRYEMSRCQRSRCGVLHRGVWCDHRDRGTGSTKCGQADVIR